MLLIVGEQAQDDMGPVHSALLRIDTEIVGLKPHLPSIT